MFQKNHTNLSFFKNTKKNAVYAIFVFAQNQLPVTRVRFYVWISEVTLRVKSKRLPGLEFSVHNILMPADYIACVEQVSICALSEEY